MAESDRPNPPKLPVYRAGKSLAELIPPDRRRRNLVLLVLASGLAGALLFFVGQRLWATSATATGLRSDLPRNRITRFAMSTNGLVSDRASPRDGAIASDGQPDQSFEVDLDGPCAALVLVSTNAEGETQGGEIWDTIINKQEVPRAATRSYVQGHETRQLAVFQGNVYDPLDPQPRNPQRDADTPANLPDGTLRELSTGRSFLRIHASDNGAFRNGRHFRLFGVSTDGSIFSSAVLEISGRPADPPPPPPGPDLDLDARPGDPGTPFNRGVAAGVLGSVDVRSCATARGPTGSGHVTVTFLPNGGVSSAAADSPPFQGTPAGSCIAAQFRKIRVPAFSGGPVTVGKSFTLGPP